MAAKRRPMELTLLAGSFDGPIRVKIPRRTYALYLMPRSALDRWRKDPELNQVGIYMMLDNPNLERPRLYIGQASIRANLDGIINRVDEHLRQGRHTWTEYVAMLVADPEPFGATELNWLEHTFIRLATEAGRSKLDNKLIPSPGYIPEEIVNDLTTTVADARLMIASMRLLFLEPPLGTSAENTPNEAATTLDQRTAPARESSSREFYMTLRGHTSKAVLLKSGGMWVLKAGAPLKPEPSNDYGQKARDAHAQDIKDGLTIRDIAFSSPSAAAVLVAGQNRNGNITWKDAQGITLGQALAEGDLS